MNSKIACTLLMAALLVLMTGPAALAQTSNLKVAVLVNSANPTGFNTDPANPGEFQRYAKLYLDHLQIPYDVLDAATTAAPDLTDRQLILTGHSGMNLLPAWQDAILAAMSAGTGFVNLDSDPNIGFEAHMQAIFGATGSATGTAASSIAVQADVLSDGASPHFIAAYQRRFLGDLGGDIVYNFHPDNNGILQTVTPTILTDATGTVIARLGSDPLVLATSFGSARAVHFGSYLYLQADRFGFVQGVDDLFWRSLVWAARKPFVIRAYPRFWAVQIDDTFSGWPSRVRDLFDVNLTGPLRADGTGGPWKVTGYVFLDHLGPGSFDRALMIEDINAGKLEIAPHSFQSIDFGDLYWNGSFGELEDSEWVANLARLNDWKIGNGGSDEIPFYSRAMVPHFWDLSNNTGYDMWNQLGFRYVTTIQRPGFRNVANDINLHNGAERISARPFRQFEAPPKTTPDEDYPFFFADDYTVGSRAGLPPQTFFLFASQYIDFGLYPRPDFIWPSSNYSFSVSASADYLERYTWRHWSALNPVELYTHDALNLEFSLPAERQAVVSQASAWLESLGVRHIFMDDLGDYIYARAKSALADVTADGSQITYTFTGSSADADGNLIPTEVLLFTGDTEGVWQEIPGFTSGLSVSLGLPPIVTSINPSAGPLEGDTSVTISGAGFAPAPNVTFGGVSAAGTTFVDEFTILAVTPPGAEGSVDVSVTTANGVGTLPQGFTYLGPPRITRISPTSGPHPGLNTLHVHGSSFTINTQVLIGGVPATSATLLSPTLLAVTMPPGAVGSSVSIAIDDPNGTDTFSGLYTYLDATTIQMQDSFNGDSPTTWQASPLGLAQGWSLFEGSFQYAGIGHTQQYAGNAAWSNYSFETKIRLADLANFPGGVRGRVNPLTGSGYTVWLYPGTGSISLFQVTGWDIDSPGLTTLASAGLSFDNSLFHTLRMSFQGSSIQVFWDGALVISVVDTAYTTGLIALDVSNRSVRYEDVLVTGPALTGFSLAPANFTSVSLGATQQLTATASYSDGSTQDVTTGSGVSYTSSNLAVATVDSNGLVTAIGNGSATITASLVGFSANATANVNVVLVVSRLSASRGSTAGGNQLDLIGANLTIGTAVTIGGQVAPVPSVSPDGTRLGVLVPAGTAGPATVTASNIWGTVTLAAGYTYMEPSTILFADDFNSGSLANWTASPLGGFANWSVDQNLAEYNGTGHTQLYAGDAGWTDYSVETKFQLFNGQNFPGGLRGRVNLSTGESYAAWLYPESREIKLFRATDWNIDATGLTLLRQVTVANIDPNIFHTLKLSFSGTQITVAYDGSNVIQVNDSALSSGAIALDVSNQQIRFDDVIVLEVPPSLVRVSPSQGSTAGGNLVDLIGANLDASTTVTVGGQTAPVLSVLPDGTRMTIAMPAGTLGPVDIAVSNANGSAILTGAYTYIDPDTILFADDFNLGSLANWTASPLGGFANWSADQNLAENNGTAHTQIYAGDPAWMNYSVETKVGLTTGQNFPGGLRGRVNLTTGEAYTAWLYPETREVKLFRTTGWDVETPGLALLGQVTVANMDVGVFHTLKLSFSGTQITVAYDGATVIQVDDAALSAGAVALDASSQVVQFEDVLVTGTNVFTPFQVGLDVAPASFTLATADATQQLNVTAVFSDGSTQDVTANPGTSYTSSNPAAASVNSTGLVTALSDGTATITATFNGFSGTATATVTISAPVISRISPTQGSALGGTRMDLFGNNLSMSTAVTIGGQSASVLSAALDGTQMTVLVPAGTVGPADIVADNSGATTTLAGGYTYLDPLSILFEDDFNLGSLANWTASPLGGFANWSADQNLAEYNGGGHTQLYAGNAGWADYSVETKFQLSSGQNYPGGLRGRVNLTTGESYAAWLYPGSREVKLFRAASWNIDTPGLALLGQVTVANMDPSLFHTLKLSFSGTQITVVYDGATVIQINDAALASGAVVLDVSNRTIQFEDVLVTQP